MPAACSVFSEAQFCAKLEKRSLGICPVGPLLCPRKHPSFQGAHSPAGEAQIGRGEVKNQLFHRLSMDSYFGDQGRLPGACALGTKGQVKFQWL